MTKNFHFRLFNQQASMHLAAVHEMLSLRNDIRNNSFNDLLSKSNDVWTFQQQNTQQPEGKIPPLQWAIDFTCSQCRKLLDDIQHTKRHLTEELFPADDQLKQYCDSVLYTLDGHVRLYNTQEQGIKRYGTTLNLEYRTINPAPAIQVMEMV
ncbi:hypothetical protein CAGGBEG34_200113 [Candidatus Glomeribacter gigasporarum BEG34]|uniref:Uncharacterized protein n=1 Tax=Candidatus Glomeribacter gigasporarum BEG34 TaxID=1070319 RepID=G2J8L1_9BURK|nr:hypothetical protein CAGGBEG34_200113 [Candidatus Glomeribacter gigasporarum BEG34]